jgi:dihydroorotate dehydrogenase
LPNSGIHAVIKKFSSSWEQSDLPVWLHLLPQNANEAAQMVHLVETLEGVSVIELALPLNDDHYLIQEMVAAAFGELPLVVCVSLDVNSRTLEIIKQAGASAIVLGAPRGKLQQGTSWVNGRLYGPALLPQILAAIQRIRECGLPIIAGCGIHDQSSGSAALQAGATAVQLDSFLWK